MIDSTLLFWVVWSNFPASIRSFKSICIWVSVLTGLFLYSHMRWGLSMCFWKITRKWILIHQVEFSIYRWSQIILDLETTYILNIHDGWDLEIKWTTDIMFWIGHNKGQCDLFFYDRHCDLFFHCKVPIFKQEYSCLFRIWGLTWWF